jgi:hypothetical protein
MFEEKNVFQFCSNILYSHCTNVFERKLVFWDFLKDMATNLNCRKRNGWDTNSKAFGQTMKIYGGHHMRDLFQLSFVGPSFKMTK